MTHKLQAVVLIILLLASQTSGLAESKPLELKWGEIGPMVSGRRVELTLTDGRKMRGEAVVVREDALVMEMKGGSSIPRSSISLIKVERPRGAWGRSLGTVIGVLAGVVVGAYVAIESTDSAGTGIHCSWGWPQGRRLAATTRAGGSTGASRGSGSCPDWGKTKWVMKVMNFAAFRLKIRLLPISGYQAVSRFLFEIVAFGFCLQVVEVL